ncbi:MAG TPA: glutathione ABC transporter substrate-binding protein [Limnochordales bacterium]
MVALALGLALTLGSGALAQGPELVVAQGADAVSLDPHRTNDQPSSRVMRQIYDTLLVQGEDLQLYPGLATEWRQLSPTRWEFKIRQGVRFHNGDVLTAHDVKFTFDRLRDPATAAPGAFILSPVANVEVVDDYTIVIETSYPFAPLLNHLAHTTTSILSRNAVTRAGDAYGTRVVVGTGPFRFEEWVTGSHIVLSRNPDYWGGEVKPGRVVFRAIPEGTVRAIELETGAVDLAYNIEPQDELRLADVPGIDLVRVETLSTTYIGFNARKPPFNDARVRQAINHAINVDAIIEHIYTGQASRAAGPISQMVWGAHPELRPYEYNPERARQLLAEAGYPNGFKTTIWTNDNPLRMQIAEVVQSDLRKVGIDVEVNVMEWGAYLRETAQGNHDMFILGWVTVTADADYGLYSLFHSSTFGDPGNRTFWSHPRVDELLDLGRTTADPQVRLRAYREAQEIIVREAPWVFLLFLTEVTGVRSNVTGFVPHPAGHHRLQQVVKR